MRWHISVIVSVNRIREVADNKMRKSLTWLCVITGCSQFRREIRCCDTDLRLRIQNVMAEFISPVHGIDGHDNCIRASDGQVRDHQLRTVLHHNQNPVASLDAKRVQSSGKAFGRVLQLAICCPRPKKNQSGSIGITPCINSKAVPERRSWRLNRRRQPARPCLDWFLVVWHPEALSLSRTKRSPQYCR